MTLKCVKKLENMKVKYGKNKMHKMLRILGLKCTKIWMIEIEK